MKGPYEVGFTSYVLADPSRPGDGAAYPYRPIPVYVWYPVDSASITQDTAQATYPLDPLYETGMLSVSSDWEKYGIDPAYQEPPPSTGRPFPLVVLSPGGTEEPRFQVDWGADAIPFYGIDVDAWRPDTPIRIDAGAFGFPVRSLADLPAGKYRVQAVLNRYETFRRADGHTIKLPPDRGEGQKWNSKPGNLYSTPREIAWDPRATDPIALLLDQQVPPVPEFQETKYVRHVRIRSERLSKFWGRDVYLGAFVTLPWGFEEHPDARYPLVINHGHFSDAPDGWREQPPDPKLEPDFSKRFNLAGYNRIQQELAWDLYQAWTGKGFPRVLLVQIQHPTPSYDDSYGVNSANNGPYGDAIQYELIPEIERRFRGIGQGWARFTYGGSTGGWEALAAQVLYPDEWNRDRSAPPVLQLTH